MGLDIYLYTKAEQEANDAFEAKWDTETDKNPHGKPYGEWSDEEKERYWKENEALPRSQHINSQQFPDNINERRYLRSSYNPGGFNSYVPEVTGSQEFSYYGIFEPIGAGDEYMLKVEDEFRVQECRRRAEECVTALEAIKDKPTYRVDSERASTLRPDLNPTPGQPMTAEEALDLFRSERAQAKTFEGGYSNAFGSFFSDDSPLEVVAAIAGQDILGSPCVHLVHKGEFHPSYLESAKVVVEFCDELLDLVRTDGCAYVHWSG